MRIQTTNYFFFLGMMILGMTRIHAQDNLMVKVKVVYSTVDTMAYVQEDMPLIAGLPAFDVNMETSLREEPDYRSTVKIRLYPGMQVEVLDPYNYVHWTKIKVGEKIGWAKKAYLYPVSGVIDHAQFLDGMTRDL